MNVRNRNREKNIQFNGNEFPSNYAKENQNCVIEI